MFNVCGSFFVFFLYFSTSEARDDRACISAQAFKRTCYVDQRARRRLLETDHHTAAACLHFNYCCHHMVSGHIPHMFEETLSI